jgi:hypothetical protein
LNTATISVAGERGYIVGQAKTNGLSLHVSHFVGIIGDRLMALMLLSFRDD